ncbi:MAG: two component transcriptional regulator, LuxR family [Flaviaesturariibacter sp.]|nr:two component transcriptional regulator, LuxR family [Flaviaesturariibacter sp.]
MNSVPANSIRILIADDHELFRDGFRVLLKKQRRIALIGEAGNGKELLTMVASLKPDVVVTDIRMPIMDGVAVCRSMQADYPHIGVIALSMYDEDNLIVEIMEAGAKGYLLKNASKEEIIEAIETAYKHQIYFSKYTSARLIDLFKESPFDPFKKAKPTELSLVDKRIIRMICEEKSSKEIADALYFSIRTIESYRRNIQEKIGVRNVAGLVIYAIKNDLYKL